jgi:murein DD-endopeptidase MepM/ murein hydrolase activator NlpD
MLRRLLLLGLCVLGLMILPVQAQDATPTPPPVDLPTINTPSNPPATVSTQTIDGLTLDILFDSLEQGRIGLLRLSGDGLSSARVRLLEKESHFIPGNEENTYYAIVVAGMDITPRRTYEFSVQAVRDDSTTTTFSGEVAVELGGFIRQDVMVGGDRAYLIDPIVERTEFARLDSIFADYTTEKLWGERGFQYPINAELTSPFGAFRVFNGTTESRHTGWDIRAPVGTPVRAMGSGRVVFAGLLDIRGNHVIVDHGYGIFSGYSHFSQVHVTRGQTVQAGQIIGVTGNTGRSSGPHLHWELTVNGEWVDTRDFIDTWLP